MQTTVEDKAASSLTGALSLANQALDIEERAKSLAEKTSEVKPSAEEKMVAKTSERLVLDDREEPEQERKTKVTVQLEQQNNQLESTGEIFKIINQQLPEVKTQQSSEPVSDQDNEDGILSYVDNSFENDLRFINGMIKNRKFRPLKGDPYHI